MEDLGLRVHNQEVCMDGGRRERRREGVGLGGHRKVVLVNNATALA